MSEIFIIKNTGKGIITGLSPENIVPVNTPNEGATGDYIPLTGTEDGKPVTGPIIANAEFDKQEDRKAFAQLSDVYDAVSYSTDEIKTGGTWIDGKPIYRKVFTNVDFRTAIYLEEENIDTPIFLDGLSIYQDSDYYFAGKRLGPIELQVLIYDDEVIPYVHVKLYNGNNDMTIMENNSIIKYIILEYTKQED